MTDIKLIGSDHWAIIRWSNGFRCGPLSRVDDGLGYLDGYVGVLALFDSSTEALDSVASDEFGGVYHTAVRLDGMLFQLRSRYESTVNLTGDYQTVLQAFALASLTYPRTAFVIEEVVGQRASVKLKAVE